MINGTQVKVEKYQKDMENDQITGDPMLYRTPKGGRRPKAAAPPFGRRRAEGPPPVEHGMCCNLIIFHIFLIFFDLILGTVDYFQAPRVCKAIFPLFLPIIFFDYFRL